MFDDLDDGRGVVACQPSVPVHQGAVGQPNPLALRRGQAVELEPLRGDLERAPGHVHADDLLKLSIGEKEPDEFPLPAAQIKYALRTAPLQHAEDGPEALLIETEIAFKGRLFGLTRLVSFL